MIIKKVSAQTQLVIDHRAPPLPLQCFHGNCFADSIEIINKDGKVFGLKCFLVAEGKNSNKTGRTGCNNMFICEIMAGERNTKYSIFMKISYDNNYWLGIHYTNITAIPISSDTMQNCL